MKWRSRSGGAPSCWVSPRSRLILTAGALVLFLWRREQLNLYRERYESEIAHRALVDQYNYLSRFANDVILLIDDDGTL